MSKDFDLPARNSQGSRLSLLYSVPFEVLENLEDATDDEEDDQAQEDEAHREEDHRVGTHPGGGILERFERSRSRFVSLVLQAYRLSDPVTSGNGDGGAGGRGESEG